MSKPIKNAIMIFTLLSVIMLLVVIIELFRLNNNADGGEIKQSSPPTQQQADPNSSEMPPDISTSQEETPSGTDTTGDDLSTDTESLPPLQPPTGTRYEIALSADLSQVLALYVDEELFEHSETGEGDDMEFTYRGTDSTLAVCMVFLPAHCQSILEGGFLDSSVYTADTPVKESQLIGRSQLQGDYVRASNADGTNEAWVYFYQNEEHGDMGIAFILNYSDDAQDTQKTAFYNILNSVQTS